MSAQAEIGEKERELLRIVARGHPDRTVTATTNGVSQQVSGLTWEELQIAAHAKFADIAEHIARLVFHRLITSGREYPTLWGKLTGQSEKIYFWVTPRGQALLNSAPEQVVEENGPFDEAIGRVKIVLGKLGYDTTLYGAGVALLSLQSGYSEAETASHLALATLAHDVKEAGFDLQKSMALVAHAGAMIDILGELKNAGLMREIFFKNDGSAMLKVAIPSSEQTSWIDKVLSDQMVAQERVATSRIDYNAMGT